jgi:hypothetical protein
MNTTLTSWYSFSDEGTTALRCAACQRLVDLEMPRIDHHPRVCPWCKVGCAFLNWKGRVLQIVPARAPAVIQQLLGFAQRQFDEIEYAELVTSMQELMDDLYGTCLPVSGERASE